MCPRPLLACGALDTALMVLWAQECAPLTGFSLDNVLLDAPMKLDGSRPVHKEIGVAVCPCKRAMVRGWRYAVDEKSTARASALALMARRLDGAYLCLVYFSDIKERTPGRASAPGLCAHKERPLAVAGPRHIRHNAHTA